MRSSSTSSITLSVAAVLVAGLAASASAAVVTETFVFNITNVTSTTATPPPVASASGAFTITYDNAVFVMDATAVSFSAFSPAYLLNIPVSYTFSPSLNGTLNVGGAALGTNVFAENSDDFLLQIETTRTTPIIGSFSLTKQGFNGLAESLTGTVSRQAVVPEPATLAVLSPAAVVATHRRRGRSRA